MEIFRDIKDFKGIYQISNLARVRSLPRIIHHKLKGKKTIKGIILKQGLSSSGYYTVSLWKNNKGESKQIHRLVAESFILNPDNKPEVNHKDGNKSNNNVDNLEWVTHKENARYAFDVLGRIGTWKGKFGRDHHRSKKVLQYDLEGKFIAIYGSASEAARLTSGSQGFISQVCRGEKRIAYNNIWRYEKC